MIKKNIKQKKIQISDQLKNISDDILFNLSNSTLEFMTKTIGRKWAFQIILELKKHSTLRNKTLARTLNGISPSTLSYLLKELQKQNLIRREAYGSIPPIVVNYSLTNQGMNLFNSLLPLFYFVSRFQQTSCADCNCIIEECKNSPTSQDCPYCKYEQCCCWEYFHKK